jgi:tRNA(Ile)-lysidine synthase
MLEPLGITSWTDPHNSNPSFARVRVRSLLAGLGADLGPGVVQGLARSADLLRDDADALDAIAGQVATQVMTVDAVSATCHVDDLAALPTAVRTRVIRAAALAMGCPADGLALEHVRRIDALITDWRGQGDVALPGGVVARRGYGRLSLIQGDGAETGVPSGA